MNCRSFYGKVTRHTLLEDGIAEVENSEGTSADIVITGPLEGGESSDIEDLHDDRRHYDRRQCAP